MPQSNRPRAVNRSRFRPKQVVHFQPLYFDLCWYTLSVRRHMAAAVASHLVKAEAQNATWWIQLAYSVRRAESIEQAEAILLRARELHQDNALIEFNLACYASVTGASRRRRLACGMPSSSIRRSVDWRSMMKICAPCGTGLPDWSSNPLNGTKQALNNLGDLCSNNAFRIFIPR